MFFICYFGITPFQLIYNLFFKGELILIGSFTGKPLNAH